MNKIYELPGDELRGEMYRRILLLMRKNRGSWQSGAAAAGLFGGLLSIFLGGLAWAVVGLLAPAGALGSFLDAAGTLLFVLPLPLLALGAHFLDLLEKKPPARQAQPRVKKVGEARKPRPPAAEIADQGARARRPKAAPRR